MSAIIMHLEFVQHLHLSNIYIHHLCFTKYKCKKVQYTRWSHYALISGVKKTYPFHSAFASRLRDV